MQGVASPTEQDVQSWISFRKRAGLRIPAPSTRRGEGRGDGGGNESGRFLRGVAKVLGVPGHVMLADGTSVSFMPPKVRTVRKVLSSLEAARALEDLGKLGGAGLRMAGPIAVLVELLMLECVTFPEGTTRPSNMREWFDDRELGEAAALTKTFASVVNMGELLEMVRPLVAGLGGAAGR